MKLCHCYVVKRLDVVNKKDVVNIIFTGFFDDKSTEITFDTGAKVSIVHSDIMSKCQRSQQMHRKLTMKY